MHRKIKRAELWAFYMVLLKALPPIHIYTDHLAIVQGMEKGSRWCCQAKRPHADVWRLIWHKLEDIGFPLAEVKISHVKAHRSLKDKPVMTAERKRHTAGNEAADHWAKAGAECDKGQYKQQVLQACEEKMKWALDFVAEAQTWPEKLGQWPDRDPKSTKPRPKGRLFVGPVHPHRISQRQDGTWQCGACGQATKSKKRAQCMQWLPCKGTVLKRAARRTGPAGCTVDLDGRLLGHILYRHGPLFFCGRCGYYAEQRSIGLQRPCTGQPAACYGPWLAALMRGVHPRSGKLLQQPRVRVTAAEAAAWRDRGGGT